MNQAVKQESTPDSDSSVPSVCMGIAPDRYTPPSRSQPIGWDEMCNSLFAIPRVTALSSGVYNAIEDNSKRMEAKLNACEQAGASYYTPAVPVKKLVNKQGHWICTIQLAGLDCDGLPPDVTPKKIAERAEARGLAAIVNTTFSHTPETPRVRVIVLLASAIVDDELYTESCYYVHDLLGLPVTDKTQLNPRSLKLSPAVLQDCASQFEVHISKGAPLVPKFRGMLEKYEPNIRTTKEQVDLKGGKSKLVDKLLIEIALAASNKFQDLYNGNWQSYGYASQSEADMAFMTQLAYWTNKDPAQMKRLFRQSKLGQREKAKRQDYVNGMVDKAISIATEVYNPDQPDPNGGSFTIEEVMAKG